MKLPFDQLLTVTALVAGIATLAMGVFGRYPFALAAGLGINAFVAFSLVGADKLSWPDAMGVIVAEGVIITAGARGLPRGRDQRDPPRPPAARALHLEQSLEDRVVGGVAAARDRPHGGHVEDAAGDVALVMPSLEKAIIGGAPETALKKLYGARLIAPSALMVETQPIGRGAMAALNGSWGSTVLSRRCGS